jgi:GNAT superfamily N-acetyltransferase/predicted nucleic acid-binding protein
MRTVAVRPSSAELESVRALWRANSATLGFFPDGAFAEHAAHGWILAAVDGGEVLGYVAYRVARARAVIVHLCVADAARGRGVATALFGALRAAVPHVRGVALSCRDDFPAAAVWPKLGFRIVGERAAREPGRKLCSWWFDIDHPDLFSAVTSSLPTVVMDANVFFDLLDPGAARAEESRALTAPWVREAYQLAVTPEVYSEIARSGDPGRRRRAREFASSFLRVTGEPAQVTAVRATLRGLLGAPARTQDVSDHSQLAHAIAGAAALFVTWDGSVLGAADRIAEAFDTVVVRPVDLVSRLDVTVRPEHYMPARLEGSNITTVRATAADERDVVRVLHNAALREPASGLAAVVRAAIADCRDTDTTVVRDAAGGVTAVIVSRASADGVLTITAARVRRHPLGPTLARHLLWRAVNDAVRRGMNLVRVTDAYLSSELQEALGDVGFVRAGDHWIKLNVRGALTYAEALARVDAADALYSLGGSLTPVTGALRAGWRATAPGEASALERALWPLTLRDAALPSFLVPIRPGWAAQLFGGDLAAGQLFGVDAERVLRLENAYYRAARPAILRAPGRVLWYVSAGEGYPQAMHVAAASALTEVVTGPASSLYRRFRRYGVFSWEHALARANGNPEGTIMAFTFSHSHLLPAPLPLRRLEDVVRARTGRGPVLQSPSKIDGGLWSDLYAAAAGEQREVSGAPPARPVVEREPEHDRDLRRDPARDARARVLPS